MGERPEWRRSTGAIAPVRRASRWARLVVLALVFPASACDGPRELAPAPPPTTARSPTSTPAPTAAPTPTAAPSPTAAPAPGLRASLDGEDLVLELDGRTARRRIPGLAAAKLELVPLRTDGTEPAVFASFLAEGNARGLLLRHGEPPLVVWGGALSSSQPGISSTSSSRWLLDVDGDGWHDLVTFRTTRDDTGSRGAPPELARFDPEVGRFVPAAPALTRKAPRQTPDSSRAFERLLAPALGAPPRDVERWVFTDLLTEPVAARGTNELAFGLGGGVLTGDTFAMLALVWKDRKALQATVHLVLARAFPEPRVLGTVALGPMGFTAPGACRPLDQRLGIRAVEGGLRVRWTPDGRTLVEQTIRREGDGLGAADGPPVVVERCVPP